MSSEAIDTYLEPTSQQYLGHYPQDEQKPISITFGSSRLHSDVPAIRSFSSESHHSPLQAADTAAAHDSQPAHVSWDKEIGLARGGDGGWLYQRPSTRSFDFPASEPETSMQRNLYSQHSGLNIRRSASAGSTPGPYGEGSQSGHTERLIPDVLAASQAPYLSGRSSVAPSTSPIVSIGSSSHSSQKRKLGDDSGEGGASDEEQLSEEEEEPSQPLLGGAFKPRKDKKRHKTSAQQLTELEEFFVVNQHPTGRVRAELAQKLNMPERSLQIWFQNR